MPNFTQPVHESNDCHTPPGSPEGGQFCATGGTRTVRQNRYDNWYGYEGGKRVKAFGNSSEQTAEQAANEWKGQSPTTSGKARPRSILDVPREPRPTPEPDKWSNFDALGEAAKRFSSLKYKGTPVTPENGFTFESAPRSRVIIKRDGMKLGVAKWVWTKKGPQFHVGGWFMYQNYPSASGGMR